jgi:hypothetical protein
VLAIALLLKRDAVNRRSNQNFKQPKRQQACNPC